MGVRLNVGSSFALAAVLLGLIAACGTPHYVATTRMWTWDGHRWEAQQSASVGGNRAEHLAYDVSHNELVLIGSDPNASGSTTATLTGGHWSLSKARTPYTANWTLAYDSRAQRLLMFDGDSVYAWTASDWFRIADDGGLPPDDPAGVSGTAPDPIAYDPHLGAVLSWDVNCFRPAVTAVKDWDGSRWSLQQLGPDSDYGDLVFDAATDQMLMVGGDCAAKAVVTWSFNGKEWKELHPATEPLLDEAGGWDHGWNLTAYDPDTGQVIVIGRSSLWAWDGTNWTELPGSRLPAGVGRGRDNGDNTTQVAYDDAAHLLVATSTSVSCNPCPVTGVP